MSIPIVRVAAVIVLVCCLMYVFLWLLRSRSQGSADGPSSFGHMRDLLKEMTPDERGELKESLFQAETRWDAEKILGEARSRHLEGSADRGYR